MPRYNRELLMDSEKLGIDPEVLMKLRYRAKRQQEDQFINEQLAARQQARAAEQAAQPVQQPTQREIDIAEAEQRRRQVWERVPGLRNLIQALGG